MKKKSYTKLLTAVTVALVLSLSTLFLGCNNKESSEDMVSLEKILHAHTLDFDFRIMVDGEQLDVPRSQMTNEVTIRVRPVNSDTFDPSYTDLIFVYTEEEALEFPDSVVTAWPTVETLKRINRFNWAWQDRDVSQTSVRDAEGNIVDVELSLEFPITLTDVMENWEDVYNLAVWTELRALGENAQGNSPEFLAKLEQLTREKYSQDIPESTIPAYEIYLAIDFDFNFRMVADDRIITEPVEILLHTQALYPKFFDPTYTELVFVETEAEALTYPDNVVTAWPTENTDFEEFLAELERLKEQRNTEVSE